MTTAPEPCRSGNTIRPPAQYVSIRYTAYLPDVDIEQSVGSVGDSYDNALAESINGLYKAEVIRRRSWKKREAVELAPWTGLTGSITGVWWSRSGTSSPAEAEANYYRQPAALPVAT